MPYILDADIERSQGQGQPGIQSKFKACVSNKREILSQK